MISALIFSILFIGLSSSTYLPIGIKTNNCGAKFSISAENEYRITATGDFNGTNCSFSFTGEIKENCVGLCYDMKNGSFIRDNGTSLTLIVGKETQVFNYKNFTIGPWCSEEINMTVILEIPENYEFHRENPGYEFTLEIYNKCGDEGTMTFEEAIKHLKGYHHGEEFHHKIYMNTIYGIIVGVCLAVIFLVVFGISVLYYRHHSERKKSRSASFGIPEADHHIRMKMKRRSEVRRASRALAEARRSSKATDGRRISEDVAKKPDRTIDIKMVRF